MGTLTGGAGGGAGGGVGDDLGVLLPPGLPLPGCLGTWGGGNEGGAGKALSMRSTNTRGGAG